MHTEESVVPVIISYSDCFRISAVYLLPDCYPVIVHLSQPMTYLTPDGRCSIARWGIVLAKFAIDTVLRFRELTSNGRRNKPIGGVASLYISSGLFFKPLKDFHKMRISGQELTTKRVVSRLQSNLESMMLAYQRIYANEDAEQFFLFPLGVLSYPSSELVAQKQNICQVMRDCISNHFCESRNILKDGCPVIAYEHLSQDRGWSNEKPDRGLVPSYVECIKRAVDILNAAGIAHMDLRPSNILWRCKTDSSVPMVEIRVIDLEDAVAFGFFIRHVDIMRLDCRYPVHERDGDRIPAAQHHNDWFLKHVTNWANQYEYKKFSDYMYAVSYSEENTEEVPVASGSSEKK